MQRTCGPSSSARCGLGARGGLIGDFALHVQCPWRIERPDGIVTGRLDLWEPVTDNAPFDEDWDCEKGPNLRDALVKQWLAQHESVLVVTSVEADEFGGAAISFNQGFLLRLFPAGTRGEDWRLFRPKTDAPHFVVSGGFGRTVKRERDWPEP